MKTKQTVGQKMKSHIKKHKTKYIVGGGITVGVGVGIYIGKRIGLEVDEESIKSKLELTNVAIGKDVSITNNITYITQLVKRGHAGNVLRCNETGELFASQNRAAEAMGIGKTKLSEYMNGKRTDVDGYTFENLGEMQAS